MMLIYIKHYLNEDGINYFVNEWFDSAIQVIKEIPGFCAVKYNRDADDKTCINMWIEFNSPEAHKQWSTSTTKDEIVGRLDPYRLKPYEAKRYVIEREFIK